MLRQQNISFLHCIIGIIQHQSMFTNVSTYSLVPRILLITIVCDPRSAQRERLDERHNRPGDKKCSCFAFAYTSVRETRKAGKYVRKQLGN